MAQNGTLGQTIEMSIDRLGGYINLPLQLNRRLYSAPTSCGTFPTALC